MWFASSMSHHEALAPWLTIEQGNGLSPTIQVSREEKVYLCTLLPNGVRGHDAH